MSALDFINFTIAMNLVVSLFNVVAYGIGYTKIKKQPIGSNAQKLTKYTFLSDFIMSIASSIGMAMVFAVALFDKDHITEFLYFLNFVLLGMNVWASVKALVYSIINRS